MEKECGLDSSEIRNLKAVSLDIGTSMAAREGGCILPCNRHWRLCSSSYADWYLDELVESCIRHICARGSHFFIFLS